MTEEQRRRKDAGQSDCLSFTISIWRQQGPNDKGQMVSYPLKRVRPEMSFLEMLDVLNGELERKGEELPISFDSDCREGICGMCGLVINGVAHGPGHGTTTCQLYMRSFADGSTITIEPWQAAAFPVIKDLAVDRSAFDRIIQEADLVACALPKEEVFIQIADNVRAPHTARWERWLTYEEFSQRLDDARVVVTHAGAGTLLSCVKRGKVAISIPRRSERGEHVDNHQVEFATKMAELGHAIVGESPEELCRLVLDYESELGKLRQRGVSSPTLGATLKRWITQGA